MGPVFARAREKALAGLFGVKGRFIPVFARAREKALANIAGASSYTYPGLRAGAREGATLLSGCGR